MGDALEALRRLKKRREPSWQARKAGPRSGGTYESRELVSSPPGASSEAALTREAFFELIQAAQARVGRVYLAGLLERLSEDEERPILEAEERMEAAARAGAFETAGRALEEWERAWLEAIKAYGGET